MLDMKDYKSPNSIYMKFLEKTKLWRQKADQWLPGTEGEREDCNQTKGNFGVMEVF